MVCRVDGKSKGLRSEDRRRGREDGEQMTDDTPVEHPRVPSTGATGQAEGTRFNGARKTEDGMKVGGGLSK